MTSGNLLRSLLVTSLLSIAVPASQAEVAYAQNFHFSRALQRSEDWCWAACIQMLLNYHGVEWSQEDIVASVKGKLEEGSASEDEINGFLNQKGLDYDGQKWEGRCAYYQGAPRPDWLVNELKADRPVIVAYRTGRRMCHVVVLHRVDYSMTPRGPIINSVVTFDPYTGEHYVVPPQVVLNSTTSHWYVDIQKDAPPRPAAPPVTPVQPQGLPAPVVVAVSESAIQVAPSVLAKKAEPKAEVEPVAAAASPETPSKTQNIAGKPASDSEPASWKLNVPISTLIPLSVSAPAEAKAESKVAGRKSGN